MFVFQFLFIYLRKQETGRGDKTERFHVLFVPQVSSVAAADGKNQKLETQLLGPSLLPLKVGSDGNLESGASGRRRDVLAGSAPAPGVSLSLRCRLVHV